MSEQTIDQRLAEQLGQVSKQVTPEMVDAMIKEKNFLLHPCKTAMTCTITLHNGFRLFGYNVTLDPAKFDLKLGEEYSFNEARNQVYQFVAYQVLEDLHRGNAPLSDAHRQLPDHIQSVIREFYSVGARLAGYTAFLNQFATLDEAAALETGIDPAEILDLKVQEEVMVKYLDILRRRLERAGV